MTTWSLEDHVQNLNYHFFKNFENIKMDKIDFLKKYCPEFITVQIQNSN